MDIAKQQTRTRRGWKLGLGLLAIPLALLGLTRAPGCVASASPVDESDLNRAAAWIGTVKRGDMVLEIRAVGRLVPETSRWISAPADGVVDALHVEAGDQVRAGETLIRLSNDEIERNALEAEFELKLERAAASAADARINSEILDLQASIAGLEADYRESELRYRANERLRADGLVAEVELEIQKVRLEELERRLKLERARMDRKRQTLESEKASQQARLEKAESLASFRKTQADDLRVAAIDGGVVTEFSVDAGTRVTRGERIARVIDPERLIAELDVPEARAKELSIGLPVSIDTRNGEVIGRLRRIDPSVQDGVVQIDVEFDGELPSGSRSALRVDGRIEVERLSQVLYTRRPANARANSRVSLFRLSTESSAERVAIQLGATSVDTVQILDGVGEGDRLILSDTSELRPSAFDFAKSRGATGGFHARSESSNRTPENFPRLRDR